MKKYSIRRVTCITLLCFIFLLIINSYPLHAQAEQDGIVLIEKGESEYSDGFYREALDSFSRGMVMVQKNNNRGRLLLDIALVHFALGDNEKCSETINFFLKENPEKKINREKFPKGFLQLYDQTQLLVQGEIVEQERLKEQKRDEDLKKTEERLRLEKEKNEAEKKEAESFLTKEPVKTEVAQPIIQEKEKPVSQLKKKKKFPLLMVILGVGAVLALVVLLGKKKNSSQSTNPTLTVNIGSGTTGTPATTTSYSKDQVVNYSYTAQADYSNLQVNLDGTTVNASGTVTMNTNHTLSVSATKIEATYSNGVLIVKGVRYELASIPAGTFQMGSNNGGSDERPVHTVRISKSFRLGKTEVTQGLWQVVMGSNPSYFPKGNTYPVEMVSWDDCQDFITKLNQMVGGNNFRLPTEAEWEYACRAGTTGDRYGNIDAIAWYSSNSGSTTHPVGQKQPNAWGLYDTLGNVWEWCQDCYGAYSAGYQTDPTGPGSGALRVYRGGGWSYYARNVRSAIRNYYSPGVRSYYFGFRLARTND